MPLAPLKDPWQQVPMVDYAQTSSNDEVSRKIFKLISVLAYIVLNYKMSISVV